MQREQGCLNTRSDFMKSLDWCAQGDETIARRYDMFVERKKAVIQQMAQLKKILRIIDFKIDYYARALAAGTMAIYDGAPRPKLPDYFD